jgi:hypothetical protein
MTSKMANKFSSEVRARAVRMVWITKASTPRAGGGLVDRRQDWLHGADAA